MYPESGSWISIFCMIFFSDRFVKQIRDPSQHLTHTHLTWLRHGQVIPWVAMSCWYYNVSHTHQNWYHLLWSRTFTGEACTATCIIMHHPSCIIMHHHHHHHHQSKIIPLLQECGCKCGESILTLGAFFIIAATAFWGASLVAPKGVGGANVVKVSAMGEGVCFFCIFHDTGRMTYGKSRWRNIRCTVLALRSQNICWVGRWVPFQQQFEMVS